MLAHPSVHYAVSANGAVAAKLDAENPQNTDLATVIYSAPLSREKALAVRQIARDYDVTFDLFADGDCLLRRDLYNRLDEFMDDPFILQSMRNTRTPVDKEPEQTIQRVNVLERVAMYWKDPADRDAIQRACPPWTASRSRVLSPKTSRSWKRAPPRAPR